MPIKPDNKLKSIATALTIGGCCIALAGLAYLFLTPKSYQAVARLKVIDWVHVPDTNNPTSPGLISDQSPDPAIMVGECDLLHSNALVDQVIQNLHLADSWGKRYHQGVVLSADESRSRFFTKTFIEPVADSSLINIRVRSEDREETAKMANELARIYRSLRDAQRQALIQDKLDALKQTWVGQNEKLSNAQAQVDQLYIDISKARATNQIRVYDADAFASNRITLEAEYVTENNELAGFKRMDQETLRQVLSSMDTNSTITPFISQLNKAKSGLLNAKLEHGPDSREAKDASLVVAQLDKAIDRQISGIILVKENKVAALKSMLNELEARARSGPAELARADAQYADYTNALETVKGLRTQRDELEAKLRADESKDAMIPTGITVDLIDSAETPSTPYVPNGTLSLGLLAAGLLFALAGLIIALIAQRREAK